MVRLCEDVEHDVLKATVRNFLINAGVAGMKKQAESRWCASRTSYACVMHALTASLLPLTIVPSLMRRLLMICSWSKTSFRPSAWRARGKGTFAQVERAVEILRGRRLPFGISCCYTSRNVEVIGSEEYFDQMIAWGAKFCWFFTYMPIGREAVPELMVSAEQHAFMYRRIRAFRETKPLFTLDFWKDGEYSKGCLADGRVYLHINANGDYEPCAFIHYSDANVRTHTFLEAQQAPLFTACRRGQPWNENHLRPCPLLGSPDALVEAVERSGARSTDLQSPEDVRALAGKCRDAAETWAPVADALWAHAHGGAGVRQIGQGHFYR